MTVRDNTCVCTLVEHCTFTMLCRSNYKTYRMPLLTCFSVNLVVEYMSCAAQRVGSVVCRGRSAIHTGRPAIIN